MKRLLIVLILTVCAVLVLGSCEHSHTPADPVMKNIVHENCGKGGSYDSVTYCADCNALLSSETITVPATGEHTGAEAVIRGDVAIIRCSDCGMEISSMPVSDTSHIHTPAEAVKENEVKPSCTYAGGYDNTVYCAEDGCEFVVYKEHVTLAPIAHTPDEPVAVGDFLVTSCADCGAFISSELIVAAPHEHTPVTVIENAVEPTCYSQGSYERVEYCSVAHCNAELSRTLCIVNMSDHVISEPKLDYNTLIYSCIFCGEEMLRTAVEKEAEHITDKLDVSVLSKPDCTSFGVYAVTLSCSVEGCKEHTSSAVIYGAPLGHTYKMGVCMVCGEALNAATSEGLSFTLSECGTFYTLSISDDDISGEVIIPAYYNALPVKAIASGAFYEREGITSVVIPEGITSIGANAFSGCTSLESVIIPEGTVEIGDNAFFGCSALLGVSIPKSTEIIGERAFAFCTSLIGIRVDEANPAYREYCGILYTKDMKTLVQYPLASEDAHCTIPYFVENIGAHAFAGASVSTLVLPGSTVSIGSHAFASSAIESIALPDSLTSIGAYAFKSCENLNSISLPASLGELGEYAFFGCHGLAAIKIPESITVIPTGAFSYCTSLTDVYLHNAVIGIGAHAFRGCSAIADIVIPASVTFIGEHAFTDCISLKDVYYSGSLSAWLAVASDVTFDPELVKIHYYSKEMVFDFENSYWHYGEFGEIVIW